MKKNEEKRINSLENALEDERVNREQYELRAQQDWVNGRRKQYMMKDMDPYYNFYGSGP